MILSLLRKTRWMAACAALMLSCMALLPANADTPAHSTPSPATTPAAEAPIAPAPPSIVIGFVGGLIRHDDAAHSEVQLAQRLQASYGKGVLVEMYENRRYRAAYQSILRFLDTDGDGKLSPQEKRNAHIILYGHSWGASAAVVLARDLEKEGIPVTLTIQVDSVQKLGQNDGIIPANVAKAVNFYQTDGPLHGRPKITAADAEHTQILGNYRFDYKKEPVVCHGYPWFGLFFSKAHIEIECDPRVWSQVETLIRQHLPPLDSH